MFAEAVARKAQERSMHVGYLETHNSFTEISSECGIPALGLYLAALFT